ncbi:AAA+ ATPase domain [Moorella glycerini]|uniref:AAA+ ATPase domain-containing protein n=1 Tax=Neomoorella stamsii TaxID=1266720 RepID=A0A9X7J4V7_9FIRM|nr:MULTISPECIES: ATP-binding protein [Moorella]PRR76750.1 hypothetical protein MOST_03940 [Moorella stamsii]CEP66716.1 AAA+ ATPase domain [Moorella glycerini]
MDYTAAKRRMEEDIIKTDVIASKDADFLATHVPFKRLRYIPGGSLEDAGTDLTEEEIYQRLVVNRNNRHQFVIIRGPNGAGKSHLIRWLKVRLESDEAYFDPEKEMVLFIQRSDNTLRGTIRQLIDAGVIRDEEKIRRYRHLLEADEVLDEDRLKNLILHHFSYEVEHDENDTFFRHSVRKEIAIFLRNDLIMQYLMEEGGPITRICDKITYSGRNNSDNEVEPLFYAQDFLFVRDLLPHLRNNADRKASRFADRLFENEKENVPEKLARYLNTLIERVIMRCARYESGDLRQVFETLRKELAAQGKNLTLFIEDITAFTAIDKELITVLVTEHGGMNEGKGLCRISSFVGITNAYYEQFRDNFKDRVTAQIEVGENVFSDRDSLRELAAKYLNAIYQPYSAFTSWVAGGARPESLPVYEDNSLPAWESVNLATGQKLTLFPFTTNALEKLYGALSLKTPRNFLRWVIREHLSCFLDDPKSFPNVASIPTSLLVWKESTHAALIDNMDLPAEEKKRLSAYLCVWGDGTAYRVPARNGFLVGGLASEAFLYFGFPDLTVNDKLPNKAQPPDKPVPTITHGDAPGRKGPEPPATPPPVSSEPVDRVMAEYQDRIASIEEWANSGEPLRTYERLRNDLYDYLVTAINWQSEGVSYYIANRMLQRRLVAIEGQPRGEEDAIIKLERSPEGRMILIGLTRWRYVGKESWSFDDAPTYQYYLVNWTYKIKDRFIAALKSVGDTPAEKWPIFEWACTVEYYRLLLAGYITGREGSEELAQKLLTDQQRPPKVDGNGHSSRWNDLLKNMWSDSRYKENKEVIRHFYNTRLGRVTDVSDKFFLYTDYILSAIEKLQAMNWTFNELPKQPSSANALTLSLTLLNELMPRIRRVAEGEKEKARAAISRLCTFYGEEITASGIVHITEKMDIFLNRLSWAHIAYRSEYSTRVSTIRANAEAIAAAVASLQGLDDSMPVNILLLRFVSDPIKIIEEAADTAASIAAEAEQIYKYYNENLQRRRKEIPDTSSRAGAVKNQINTIKAQLNVLWGGDRAGGIAR